KLRDGVESSAICYLRHPPSRIDEQFLRVLHAHARNKFREGDLRGLLECLAEIIFAHMHVVGNLTQSDSFTCVSINKVFGLYYAGWFVSPCGDERASSGFGQLRGQRH